MWILYYINKERINQLASQIQPQQIKEVTERKKKRISNQGKAKGIFNLGFLSKVINPSIEIEANRATDTEFDSEHKIEYNTADVQLNNVLCKLQKIDYIFLNDEIPKINCKKLKGIIRFRGECHPLIEGESISERLANYEMTDSVSWTCKIANIKLSFATGKNSLISNTPIHYALDEKNGKLYFDGFGTVITKNSNSLKIIPIIIGTQLANF